jgi:uncharacterized C2H2 Zn-finger protein
MSFFFNIKTEGGRIFTMDKKLVENVKCKHCDRVYKAKSQYNYHLQKVHNYTKEDAGNHCRSLNVLTWSEKALYEKTKKSNLEKYGCENVFGAKKIQDKIKNTCVKKYGVENPGQAQEVKEKIANTFEENYGGHPFANEGVKSKIRSTFIDRYGVDNSSKIPEVMERKKLTCLEKYGHEWHLSSPEIQKLITETSLERYGVKRAACLEEVIAKQHQTHIEKYGCWYSQTDEHQASLYQWKDYELPSGRNIRVQGYEPWALDHLLKTYDEDDLAITSEEITESACKVWYDMNDTTHRYFPDIFIKSEQKFIEVKSQYTYAQHKEMNLAKRDRCRELGYEFEFMVFENTRPDTVTII